MGRERGGYDAPSPDQCIAAITELMYHSAVDENGLITGPGRILNYTGLDIIPSKLVSIHTWFRRDQEICCICVGHAGRGRERLSHEIVL